MKLKELVTKRWISIYLLIVVAALYFIYSLGFMTVFYRLFYDGNQRMLEVFKDLQLFNGFVFENSLITLVLAILSLALGLHIKKCNILTGIYLSGFIAYEISMFGTLTRAVPYYVNKYMSLDFSSLKDYKPSPWMIQISFLFVIGIFALLSITVICFVIQAVRKIRESKGAKSYEEG